MAVPELTFLWMSALGIVTGIPALLNVDKGTRILSSVLSMVFWGVWAISAYQVDGAFTGETYTFTPLVYVGYGMAALMLAFAIYHSYEALVERAD